MKFLSKFNISRRVGLCQQFDYTILHGGTVHLFGICLILLAIASSGCRATSWERVKNSNNTDQIWEFIQKNPNDDHVADARKKIAYLEYRQALASDTPYAYKMFLERHPDSTHCFKVRRRLEEKEFSNAKSKKDPLAIVAFIRKWPKGNKTIEAKNLLEGMVCNSKVSTDVLPTVISIISEQIDSKCLQRISNEKRILEFRKVILKNDISEDYRYISKYPGSIEAKEVRRKLILRKVLAMLNAARFEQATEYIKQQQIDNRDYLFDMVAKRHKQWQLSSSHNNRDRKLIDSIRVLRKHLESSCCQKSCGSLVENQVDPQIIWQCAQCYQFCPEEDVAKWLLGQIDNNFIQVKFNGLTSLENVLDLIGPVRAKIWLHEEINKLSPIAVSDQPLFKLAILYSLLGETSKALMKMENLLSTSKIRNDLLGLFLAAKWSNQLGLNKKTAAFTKRFSSVIIQYTRLRIDAWREEGLDSSDRGWLTLRQFVGIITIWQEAISPFITGKKDALSEYQSIFGNWLGESLSELNKTKIWYLEEKAVYFDKFTNNKREEEKCEMEDSLSEEEKSSIINLLYSDYTHSKPTLDYLVCCHPKKKVRNFSKIVVESYLFLCKFFVVFQDQWK
jgi:hypothetical protein